MNACVTWKQRGTDKQSLGGYFKNDSAKQQCSILPLMKSQNTKWDTEPQNTCYWLWQFKEALAEPQTVSLAQKRVISWGMPASIETQLLLQMECLEEVLGNVLSRLQAVTCAQKYGRLAYFWVESGIGLISGPIILLCFSQSQLWRFPSTMDAQRGAQNKEHVLAVG